MKYRIGVDEILSRLKGRTLSHVLGAFYEAYAERAGRDAQHPVPLGIAGAHGVGHAALFAALARETHIGFVHQGRRLQCLARPLTPQVGRGEAHHAEPERHQEAVDRSFAEALARRGSWGPVDWQVTGADGR